MKRSIQRLLERARKRARWYAADPARAAKLISEAKRKADQQKGRLDQVWTELAALFRLVRAWAGGRYKQISLKTILLVIAAIIYFVNPLDVIPDFVPGFGLIDDVSVIAYVVHSVRKEIEGFLSWEQSARPEAGADFRG